MEIVHLKKKSAEITMEDIKDTILGSECMFCNRSDAPHLKEICEKIKKVSGDMDKKTCPYFATDSSYIRIMCHFLSKEKNCSILYKKGNVKELYFQEGATDINPALLPKTRQKNHERYPDGTHVVTW